MKRNPNARERRLMESRIFELRKKVDRYLQVGDSETVNRLQSDIAYLQRVSGVVKGAKEREGNERTA